MNIQNMILSRFAIFIKNRLRTTARDNTNITYRRTPNFSFRGFFGCL